MRPDSVGHPVFILDAFKVSVNENFSTLLDFVFVFFIFGMSGS